jgi:hypothetical protein
MIMEDKMRNIKIGTLLAVGAGLFGLMPIEQACAGSFTQQGETIGLATGAPLPEGLYLIDISSYGNNRGSGYDSGLFVHTPVLAWSTPWTLAGARVEFLTTPPQVIVGNSTPGANSFLAAFYNPYASVALAWDLGGGFSFTNYLGVYFPIGNELNQNFWVFNERAAISYTANGWNLTAYTVTGLTGTNAQGQRTAPDYFNYDLTATKTFGKYTLGGGAFGSFDLSGTSSPTYKRQSQFALAILAGYDFGSFTAQLYLSHDVANNNYLDSNGHEVFETRLWAHLIVPLWVAPKPTVVAAKF